MDDSENIVYAGFLYDQDPTLLMLITTCREENCSYLSLAKIQESDTDFE